MKLTIYKNTPSDFALASSSAEMQGGETIHISQEVYEYLRVCRDDVRYLIIEKSKEIDKKFPGLEIEMRYLKNLIINIL